MRTLKNIIKSMTESDLASDYGLDRLIVEKFGSDDVVTFLDTDNSSIADTLNYDGLLNETIEGAIDIYYYDQRKWVIDNFEYVERAIEDGLCDGVTDFHTLIQWGQYVYHSDELYRQLDSLIKNIKYAIKESI